MNLREVMADCLALMEGAGLKLFGRRLGPATIQAFVAVCESRGYGEPDLLRRAAISFCQEDGEFPTAAQFAARCRQVWESDHVQVGLPDGDVVRIAWVPVRDYQALPRDGGGEVPEAEVAALMARLDSLA
jgi:hypothetical protein